MPDVWSEYPTGYPKRIADRLHGPQVHVDKRRWVFSIAMEHRNLTAGSTGLLQHVQHRRNIVHRSHAGRGNDPPAQTANLTQIGAGS